MTQVGAAGRSSSGNTHEERNDRTTRPRHPIAREAGRYEIRLTGHLDAHWAAWFDGLTVSHEADGTTVISGPIADQAALHGLLQRVRDLGLPLVSVTRIDDTPPIRTHRDGLATDIDGPKGHFHGLDAKTALVAGVLYLLTFASSIPAALLLGPALTDPTYILGAGADGQVRLAALFDIVNGLAAIGTAVALYSVAEAPARGLRDRLRRHPDRSRPPSSSSAS